MWLVSKGCLEYFFFVLCLNIFPSYKEKWTHILGILELFVKSNAVAIEIAFYCYFQCYKLH